jgi:hypothetical protein
MVWIAVFCLAALGCFTVIRSIVRPGVAAAPASLASDDIDTPLAKGDRFPLIDSDILRQAGLDALKRSAVPTNVPEPKAAADNVVIAAPKAAPAADEVVSWHWREGSKVVRRRQSQ